MQHFMRVSGNIGVERVDIADGEDIAALFHASLSFVACEASDQVDWIFDGSRFVAPTVAPPSKAALAAYAAQVRYARETSGFTYAGHLIDTSREAQATIGNAALGATVVGPSFTTQWKAKDGAFFNLDHDGVLAMAVAVMSFVNGCFATEASVRTSIESGSITTTDAVDAAFA